VETAKPLHGSNVNIIFYKRQSTSFKSNTL